MKIRKKLGKIKIWHLSCNFVIYSTIYDAQRLCRLFGSQANVESNALLSDDHAKENYFYKLKPDVQKDSQENTDKISMKDVGLITLFGLILPSFDQGSDYYTSWNLIQSEDQRIRGYGYTMLGRDHLKFFDQVFGIKPLMHLLEICIFH